LNLWQNFENQIPDHRRKQLLRGMDLNFLRSVTEKVGLQHYFLASTIKNRERQKKGLGLVIPCYVSTAVVLLSPFPFIFLLYFCALERLRRLPG
jgi:hypothetical protein